MADDVAMLDLTDHTLHRPSSVHMVTRCGITLDHCQVGPADVLRTRARQLCTSCWG